MNVQGQMSKVKVAKLLLSEFRVAKSNGKVRILIGSSQIAVCVHAQYIFSQKQPRSTSALLHDLQVAIHSQLLRFLVINIKNLLF